MEKRAIRIPDSTFSRTRKSPDQVPHCRHGRTTGYRNLIRETDLIQSGLVLVDPLCVQLHDV